ncbi:MAG: SH3 domain-containing protein [Chloroflexi bacterium]|nr:SH3 domain-containing protein [Chloroflexota bacterium]
MAIRAGHATTRSPKYALGPGADLPVARIVALLLIVLAIGALWMISNVAKAPPSQGAEDLANFNPRSLLTDNTPHFLPTPVAALPPDANAGPPAPASDDANATSSEATGEQVKVANTGGIGAILRADPPKGRQVAALRDGTVLKVIEHQDVDGSEWLHVRTPDGAEGWIFSRLVAPAQ